MKEAKGTLFSQPVTYFDFIVNCNSSGYPEIISRLKAETKEKGEQNDS
jgi:hypothetical protein